MIDHLEDPVEKSAGLGTVHEWPVLGSEGGKWILMIKAGMFWEEEMQSHPRSTSNLSRFHRHFTQPRQKYCNHAGDKRCYGRFTSTVILHDRLTESLSYTSPPALIATHRPMHRMNGDR
jgi:hypothetical protein